MECKFAKLSIEQMTYLVSADIDRHIVSGDKISEVKEKLSLYATEGEKLSDTYDRLTAIRNSVVDMLGSLTASAIEHGDYELYEQLQANMSGITAVIDSMLMGIECKMN